jgi:Trans-aconitate methyltransferase
MPDSQTIALYDARAADYAARLGAIPEENAAFLRFAAALPPGRVLDLGCGPGTWSAAFLARGLTVDAWDASQGMVDAARAQGVRARVATFDDLKSANAYAGIWANFSLVHAQRAALPRHLGAIARALQPAGVLHLGMKTGTGAARDSLGRLYTYVTEAELQTLVTGAGLSVLQSETGESPGFDGTVSPWVTLLARRDA